MKLNVEKWKEFYIGKVFQTNIAKSIDFGNTNEGENPFVGRTSNNNGIQGYVSERTVEKGNCIIIGMVGENWAFYQPRSFVSSQNIFVLRTECLNVFNAMFLCSILNKCVEIYRKTYALPLGKEKMNGRTIKLPIQYNSDGLPLLDNTYKYSDQGYVPDWQFMEDYIKSLHYKPLTTKRVNEKKTKLNVSQWEDFVFDDIFNIVHGTRLTKEDMEEGNTPFIGAIDSNNGVREYIGQAPLCSKNCVTVNYNGSVGEAFYQNRDFWASDDVNSLYAKGWQMNPQIGLFLATVIKADKYRYACGRKWNAEKMRASVIKLPIQYNSDGTPVIDKEKKYNRKGYIPDWQFMEDYINSLPYSDRI